jgi:NitT/TauT family transport system substrate-binding protein
MPQSLSTIRRRHLLQLLSGATGAVLLHACQRTTADSNANSATGSATEGSSAESGAATMSLNLGTVSWIGQAPLYIAQEKGFYAEEGLDLKVRVFGSAGEYMSAFLSNQLDGVSPVTSEAILMKSQGKDFKIVLVQDNSVGADGILAKNSIASIEDFKGKKVAVDTSGVSYFFLLQVLKEAGLSADDITPVNVAPDAAAAAYQSNNADIAVTYAPYLQEAADAVTDGRIIYDSTKMPTAINDLYIFDTAFIQENPETIQAFVNGTMKGLKFLEENPEEGLTIGAAQLEMEKEALEADLKGLKLPDQEANLQMLAEPESEMYLAKTLEELAAFLLSEGQIESDPGDLSTLLDPQFVQAAEL